MPQCVLCGGCAVLHVIFTQYANSAAAVDRYTAVLFLAGAAIILTSCFTGVAVLDKVAGERVADVSRDLARHNVPPSVL